MKHFWFWAAWTMNFRAEIDKWLHNLNRVARYINWWRGSSWVDGGLDLGLPIFSSGEWTPSKLPLVDLAVVHSYLSRLKNLGFCSLIDWLKGERIVVRVLPECCWCSGSVPSTSAENSPTPTDRTTLLDTKTDSCGSVEKTPTNSCRDVLSWLQRITRWFTLTSRRWVCAVGWNCFLQQFLPVLTHFFIAWSVCHLMTMTTSTGAN